MQRIEKDSLGSMEIPSEALYGIHSVRASLNFPVNTRFPAEWYRAMGIVKSSCFSTYRRFRDAALNNYNNPQGITIIEDSILESITVAARDIAKGRYYDQFIVPALQGGAGTSINMNINEIIANAALTHKGKQPGNYTVIDPLEHCNIYQSTNDVVPTALTIATMELLDILGRDINGVRGELERLEKRYRNVLRPGYTQMQEAVPSSFGLLFGSYNEALSRDWWRVSKCQERIRTINMGGGATGTGLAVPRYFIMEIVPELRKITGLPLSRSENMPDATSNLDRWVEVHATIKAHAVNMEKIASDLRLLSSDLMNPRQIQIPDKQMGSSIMPGKINPVIPEFVISAAHKVYSNDQLITSLAAMGTLELNAYIPVIGSSMLESLNLLIAANKTLMSNMISGIEINSEEAYQRVIHSPAITTVLVPHIGYNKASEIAMLMKDNGITIFEANRTLKYVSDSTIKRLTEPGNLLKLGYSLEEL